MVGRAVLLALVACSVAHIGAAPATADTELRALIDYTGRADPRLCPSPMCGGIWLDAVNDADGNCSGQRGRECYVTELTRYESGATEKARLRTLVTERGGLVSGSMTPAKIDGFPNLRALLVVNAWRPASSRKPEGAFRLLVDNRIRCVRAPCYAISTTTLNAKRSATVSGIDLRATGASAAERRWALKLLAARGLIAAGKIARASNGGRTFVATQLYLPAR